MKFIFILTLFTLSVFNLAAQNPSLNAVSYITGLVKPTTITHCKDARIFVVEQDGRIRIIRNDSLLPTSFLDINPIVGSSGNEQGLLGLAFHPNYKTNGFFYVNYTNNSGNTIIARYSVDPADSSRALSSSAQILMTINQPYSNHNGGEVAFGPDGYLYIFTGDGGSANDPQNRAQNKAEKLGKILRINVNVPSGYAIPVDNFYINNLTAAKEIWNVGIRNPWRADFDDITGDLWFADVGQNLYEEVNFQAAGSGNGLNYGWRCYEGNNPFNTTGCLSQASYEPAVYEYLHAGGNCSVTGGVIYRGGRYKNMFGHYIFTDFCVPSLRTLKKNGSSFNYLAHSTVSGAGLSCFGEDYLGEVYAGGLYTGAIYKIVDSSSPDHVAWLSDSDSLVVCGTDVTLKSPMCTDCTYEWFFNGVSTLTTSNSFLATSNGEYVVKVGDSVLTTFNYDTLYVLFKTPATQAQIVGLDSIYCVYNQSDSLDLIPLGGTLSGTGVLGSNFVPTSAGLGVHVINYLFTDTNGCQSSVSQVVNVDACTGLSLEESSYIQRVYPNPANEKLTVSLNLQKQINASIDINDISGRLINSLNLDLPSGQQEITIDCTDIANGNYLLKLTTENNQSIMPFVVVHN